jgi:hypothetical protein
MSAAGAQQATPRLRESDRGMTPRPWTGSLKSSYIQRQIANLPRQGDREPWIVPERYLTERATILREPVDDGVLVFERGSARRDPAAA